MVQMMNQTYLKTKQTFSNQGTNGKLDEPVVAVCECGHTKGITFRNLKNRWPHCPKCKQPMKVLPNAATPSV